jgi:hypothetical protein
VSFSARDFDQAREVCLLGEQVKRQLFAGRQALGRQVLLGDIAFSVANRLTRTSPKLCRVARAAGRSSLISQPAWARLLRSFWLGFGITLHWQWSGNLAPCQPPLASIGYALKALKCYGSAAREHLHDLDHLAANQHVRYYLRRAAHSAAEAIREALRLEQQGARHKCVRCGRETTDEEHTRSQHAFQRTFCDTCFDEVFLDSMSMSNTGDWIPPTIKSAC